MFKDSDTFKAELNAELAKRPRGQRDLLIFVHGYNTNFSDAVLRVSQFTHDTGFKGVPVLFTWASRGRTLNYVYDLNSALHARFYLVELAQVAADTNAEGFDIVAHSMGNLVTLEAMIELEARNFNPKVPLKNVILAAPDVDFDLFSEHIKILRKLRDKIFVFVSKDDQALGLSQVIAGGVNRAGAADPNTLATIGINVIDLSQIRDTNQVHHTKFADSPEIVQLIGRGLNSGSTFSATNEGTPNTVIGSVFQSIVRLPSRAVNETSGGVLTLAN